MSDRFQGTVKWYNPDKGYGFISAEGGDLFVHRRSIADARGDLVDGQGVEFDVRQGLKGLEAYDVVVVADVEVPAHRARAYASPGAGTGYARSGGGGVRGPREPYTGPLPTEPVSGTVKSVDPAGRFLFVRTDGAPIDVFVHSSLAPRNGRQLREGDRVQLLVEASDRGPRASWLEAA